MVYKHREELFLVLAYNKLYYLEINVDHDWSWKPEWDKASEDRKVLVHHQVARVRVLPAVEDTHVTLHPTWVLNRGTNSVLSNVETSEVSKLSTL